MRLVALFVVLAAALIGSAHADVYFSGNFEITDNISAPVCQNPFVSVLLPSLCNCVNNNNTEVVKLFYTAGDTRLPSKDYGTCLCYTQTSGSVQKYWVQSTNPEIL